MVSITIADRRSDAETIASIVEKMGYEPLIVHCPPDETFLQPSVAVLCGSFHGEFMQILRKWERIGKPRSGFLLITGSDQFTRELNEIEQLTVIEKPISLHVVRYRIDQALRHAHQASQNDFLAPESQNS